MKRDPILVERVAELARLELSEETKKQLGSDLTKILHYVEKLESVDTHNTEPTYNIVEETNIFNPDQVAAHLPNESLIKNAPELHKNFVEVPQIIETL